MERQTLTVEETAEILGIGRNSAYEAVRQGRLPVVRMGKRYLVPKAALEEMLATTTAVQPAAVQSGGGASNGRK